MAVLAQRERAKAVADAPPVAPAELARELEAFLAEHPRAVMMEEGRVAFDMREAKYALAAEHGRCTLQVWSEERNMVRRVVGTALRHDVLKISTIKFGQTRPQTLELVADKDRRTPTARDATRKQYLRLLERVLLRQFAEWKPTGFRSAMDLERSFGPAYARGTLVRGQNAWAVIAINAEESQSSMDGILTLGILWLAHCREHGNGKRLFQGLRIVMPRGTAALTLSRMAWLHPNAAQWELWELDERTEDVEQRDLADQGNLATKLLHAPNVAAAQERFAAAAARVRGLLPEPMRAVMQEVVHHGSEMAFTLHGLEFARVRMGVAANSFNRHEEITFGTGANETPLTAENEGQFRAMMGELFARRHAAGDKRDALYRMQPEGWLESVLRQNVEPLDEHLQAEHVYTQVPAFAAGDRGMLDLLSVTRDGRLAVIELKADEDLHLALQGLDYWVRVRWHQRESDHATGLPEFQRHGYFGGVALSELPPRLYLVAPALRIHPATETVLKYLKPEVEWTLVAVDERWRDEVRVVFRKRSRGQR
jgi:hypothetical protein